MSLSFILILFGNLSWMVTYLNIIYGNYLVKHSLMIEICLYLNLSWEFLYAFIYPTSNLLMGSTFVIWFLLDFIMFVQLIYYEYSFKNNKFLMMFIVMIKLTLAFLFIYIFDYSVNKAVGFQKHEAAMFSAFLINLFMSYSYLTDNYSKYNLKNGRTMAIFKMLGTLLTTLSVFMDKEVLYPLLTKEISLYCGFACFILDFIFVYMIYSQNGKSV
jgi:hypothetical protein